MGLPGILKPVASMPVVETEVKIKVLADAPAWSMNGPGTSNGLLVISGQPGSGKSHLSSGYGHLAATAGYHVLWCEIRDLLPQLHKALIEGTVARMLRRLAKFDLLVLNDLRRMPVKDEYASLLYDVYGVKRRLFRQNPS
jgi:DNA replication protein DnaC